MKKEIKRLLIDHQKNHSEFQIDNFIVGNAGDDWARYKQALREIDSRNEIAEGLRDELILFDLAWCGPFWKRIAVTKNARVRRAIRIKRRERSRSALVESIAETERELFRFVELAIRLKEKIGEIDPARRKELESDSWKQKAVRMAGIDLLINGRVGSATLEFILSLPRQDRVAVIEYFKPGAKVDPFKMIGL